MPSLALRCSPRPQTRGSQVSGTAPPLAAGAPATTPLDCGPRAAGRAGPISNLWPSPRPASGLGVSGQGWVEAAAPASPRLRSRPRVQDVSDVMKRSEFWTLKKPEALPTKLKSMFRVPDLKRMLRVFRELTDVQSYWVDVTLNPHTANLNLVMSKNRRQVRFVGATLPGSYLEEHYDCGILGSQHFSSGKHYWEVDVAKKTDWILGVCSNSAEPTYCFNQFTNNRNVYSRYQPQSGYWVIGLHHKHEYRAYEESSTSLLLSMMVPPRRVGIFLDYEAGTVSFYNVTNHGFPIYTFSKYYFPSTLSPYFNPCNCVVPMTLRRPSS